MSLDSDGLTLLDGIEQSRKLRLCFGCRNFAHILSKYFDQSNMAYRETIDKLDLPPTQ